MRNRALIHINKLPDFKDFLERKGYTLVDTKGTYEAIRAKGHGKTVIFHIKYKAVHLTCHGDGLKLAWQFINENQKKGK